MPQERKFRVVADWEPAGDQPQAIESSCEALRTARSDQTLLGVTGTGKTFTMANVIERSEPRWSWRTTRRWPRSSTASSGSSFPTTPSHYFVSYYDYYQPEAYIPQTDTYIEKDARSTTRSTGCGTPPPAPCSSGADVIIVASVSCIYGLGSPEDYAG